MQGERSAQHYAKDAAKARSDLNMFHAIIALCESSLFSSSSFNAETRIVAICKRESAKCLARYDAAMEKIGATHAE